MTNNNELSEIREEIKNNFENNMDPDFAKDLLKDINENEFSIDLVKYLISQIKKYNNCITENFAEYLTGKLEGFIPQKEDSKPSFVPQAHVDEKAAVEAAESKPAAEEKSKLSSDFLK